MCVITATTRIEGDLYRQLLNVIVLEILLEPFKLAAKGKLPIPNPEISGSYFDNIAAALYSVLGDDVGNRQLMGYLGVKSTVCSRFCKNENGDFEGLARGDVKEELREDADVELWDKPFSSVTAREKALNALGLHRIAPAIRLIPGFSKGYFQNHNICFLHCNRLGLWKRNQLKLVKEEAFEALELVDDRVVLATESVKSCERVAHVFDSRGAKDYSEVKTPIHSASMVGNVALCLEVAVHDVVSDTLLTSITAQLDFEELFAPWVPFTGQWPNLFDQRRSHFLLSYMEARHAVADKRHAALKCHRCNQLLISLSSQCWTQLKRHYCDRCKQVCTLFGRIHAIHAEKC